MATDTVNTHLKTGRASGLLLHPTSLPGPHGLGSLGRMAEWFVDFLANARQTFWQVLPLGPTGYGDSPYQCYSAFAGNPVLIDLDRLTETGLVSQADLAGAPGCPPGRADFGKSVIFREPVLRKAFESFCRIAGDRHENYLKFLADHAFWLKDYCLFRAIKDSLDGQAWTEWPKPLRMRDRDALAEAELRLGESVRYHMFLQYLFFTQWAAVHDHAKRRGVRIIGDMPIFVSADSADVWSNPDLFQLASDGYPTAVAGVPPDYFSESGQLWGNPLYRWDQLEEQKFGWWIERFRALMTLVDVIRIDHFRGFEAYWEVPAGEKTAKNGRWVKGPGVKFFEAVQKTGFDIPIIAEDLGFITREVIELRDAFSLPGMKILQFAFGGDAANSYLPHNYTNANCVVYTGTHDNDTTLGWFNGSGRRSRAHRAERKRIVAHIRRYLGFKPKQVHWDMIRLAATSVAKIAIYPVQDVLGLGSEARMNLPGTPGGNWSWRLSSIEALEQVCGQLKEITELYGRG